MGSFLWMDPQLDLSMCKFLFFPTECATRTGNKKMTNNEPLSFMLTNNFCVLTNPTLHNKNLQHSCKGKSLSSSWRLMDIWQNLFRRKMTMHETFKCTKASQHKEVLSLEWIKFNAFSQVTLQKLLFFFLSLLPPQKDHILNLSQPPKADKSVPSCWHKVTRFYFCPVEDRCDDRGECAWRKP